MLVLGKKSFYRATGGNRAQETNSGCAKQRYATGEPDKVQGRGRVGIVEGSCGYRARGVSIRGQFVLSRNLGYKTRMAKHRSEPHVAYPEVQVHVRDQVRVVGSVAAFAQRRDDTQRKSVFSSPRGKWAWGTCTGCPPAAKRHGRARQS